MGTTDSTVNSPARFGFRRGQQDQMLALAQIRLARHTHVASHRAGIDHRKGSWLLGHRSWDLVGESARPLTGVERQETRRIRCHA